MALLDEITGPADLRAMSDADLETLAHEIRERTIDAVAAHAGHLGPNLGVVELTLALHRVFDSPRDRIVWDTGHQAYVHKMVTGRAGDFDTLRQEGGLSGYPSRAESEHDWVENSHASTSLSYAEGMARANQVLGRDDHVVAVIGDGAMTGGMAWEAINNIAASQDRRVVIVVNDNGRSYQPTVGGLANRLTDIRTNPRYEPALGAIRERLNRGGSVGPAAYDALHAIKKGLKDVLAPQGMFEDLGLKYVGPVDGHDRKAVESALAHAKRFGGPVLVHVLTTKGQGYDIAVANENDQMHQAPQFDRTTGDAVSVAPAGWTSVFRDEVVRIADERPDVVGITAAMLYPVCCSTSPSTGAASRSCSTARASPATTARATTACGTCRCCSSCRGCAWPRRATAHGCASCCARPSTSTTRPRWCASRRVPCPPTSRRSTRSARATCSPAATARTSSCSRSARWCPPASRRRSSCRRRGWGSRSSTRAGSSRSTPPSSGSPPSTASS